MKNEKKQSNYLTTLIMIILGIIYFVYKLSLID